MEGKQALDFGASSDFPSLLRLQGLLSPAAQIGPMNARGEIVPTESTTILAFKFSDGVLVAGDRRATSGNTVVYDRADKVLEIDQRSIMAIAGVPATAWVMAQVLEHSFQFFRRTQLQEMSVDGKVRALSKLLRDNFGFALQGVGIVVPIFATYDVKASPSARLYFYDAMGAQFEATDFAATGSGSPAVRGILYYENTWGEKPLQKREEDEAVAIALRALDTAAESDTATGGVDRSGKIFPVIKTVSRDGITTLPEQKTAAIFKKELASTEGFTRSSADVSLRRLAHYSLSPLMKAAFEQVYGPPYLARLLFAEVGAKPEEDLFLRVEYDGAIATNGATLSQLRQDFAVWSANRQSTELMESFLKSSPLTNAPLESAINFALNAWSLGHMTGGHNGAKEMPELAAIGKHLQEQ